MKKVIVMLIAGSVALAASADLTDFKWQATGNGQVGAGESVNTVIGFDINSLVSGGQIDIADLAAISIYNTQASVAIPAFLGGGWQTGNMIDDGTLDGVLAYAIIGDIGAATVGSTFLFSLGTGPITDRQPDPGFPASPTQGLNPGTLNTVTVIPEPATVGLFGLGALGAWILRRSKKAQIEA